MTIRTKSWLQTRIGLDLSGRGLKKVRENAYSTYQYLKDLIDSCTFQDADGKITVNGIVTTGATPLLMEDTVWEDLRFPATNINPPGQVADPDFDTTNVGWLFDAGGTEILYIVAQLPHSYKEGTNLRCHVHWNPTNTNGGNVLWRISYRWRNNEDAAVGFTDVDVTAVANGTAGKLQFNLFADLVKADAEISSILDIKFQRIGGSDTYNADALFKEFDIHFEKNTVGSREPWIK